MRKHIFFRIAIVPVLLVTMQSCCVARQYSRPEVVDSEYFRTNALARDSATIADVSWREIFTDPILVGHLERELERHIDIQVALKQIELAHAYFPTGKHNSL